MNGLIIVNSFKKLEATVYKTQRLVSVFATLGVEMDVKRSLDINIDVTSSSVHADLTKYAFGIYLDKDESLALALEKKLPLFNSAEAMIKCNDKLKTFLALEGSGIKTPKTIPSRLCFRSEELDLSLLSAFDRKVGQELGYPLIVKECFGSLGLQVYLIRNEAELIQKDIELALKPHIYQEFISSSVGKDVRMLTIGGKLAAAMERINDHDFRSNIAVGGHGEKITPSPAFISAAEKASQVLGLDYAGVDLLFGPNGEPVLTEVNSNPFFTGIEEVSKVDVTALLANHILSKLKIC